MAGEYDDHARAMRDKLNAVSPSLCLAKWLQVSLHLPQGMTQSCYHPPTHIIPLHNLTTSPDSLHNTTIKIEERKQMLSGTRPPGCAYCWKMEDAGDHISDRSYRSSEWWSAPDFDKIVSGTETEHAVPRYVEVNFNQSCNFKCMYCSPHLSSTWEEEIRKFGPYSLRSGEHMHNNIMALESRGMMPRPGSQKENPYVDAFWKWWPEIYRKLRVFRMTGGEPLMDKNTFKVLDYVNEHPHGLLELSITSNLCPPDQKLFTNFVSKVQALEKIRNWEDLDNFNVDSGNNCFISPAYKHFMLFVSLDGYGKQAEYMRTGMNFEQLLANVKTYLSETQHSSISFINTFNLLSVPSLQQFLQMILDLRTEFGGTNQKEIEIKSLVTGPLTHSAYKKSKFQRIWFDIPILRSPNWFSIQNATQREIDIVKKCIEFMEANVQKDDYLDTFEGFKPYEILKLKRDLAIMEQSLPTDQATMNKIMFYEFITEYDSRRNLDFLATFPELTQYFKDCQRAFLRG